MPCQRTMHPVRLVNESNLNKASFKFFVFLGLIENGSVISAGSGARSARSLWPVKSSPASDHNNNQVHVHFAHPIMTPSNRLHRNALENCESTLSSSGGIDPDKDEAETTPIILDAPDFLTQMFTMLVDFNSALGNLQTSMDDVDREIAIASNVAMGKGPYTEVRFIDGSLPSEPAAGH
ncbi:hypothetical protein BT96DRAFT_639546 [Gymnopus androsaceus JB14]|uniref:Uncharacterized protein n=1 Tax=Gymnopus androsaceus JB14 TaxID=1447944 RepID=A0A6A4HUU9_9AGAR|nr:hypothetical protein BT96DRAFT_639546 [Gymnopus androsaceus JB14]